MATDLARLSFNEARRRVLQAGAGALGAALSPAALGRGKPSSSKSKSASGALAASFADVRERYGPTRLTLRGRWPDELQGVLYRNGPARFARGDTRYAHWFDGDGMVHAYRFVNGSIEHQARMVATERSVAEERAGRFLWNGFGTRFADARPTRSPENMNVANISVLPMGDEVLALWEAGAAWRLDGTSLATLGRRNWSDATTAAPFGAHPRVDPDGRIWNIGYLAGSGKLLIYDIAASGNLQRHAMIETANADMVHDFAVTEHYLVLLLTPLEFRRDDTLAFADALHWQPGKPNQLVLVDKHSLRVARRFDAPPGFFFHLGNAFEDGGSLRLQVMNGPPYDMLMRAVRQATAGHAIAPLQSTIASELVVDLANGRVRVHDLPLRDSDFPAWDLHRTGRATDQLVSLGASDALGKEVFGFDTVQVFDRRDERVRRFSYDDHSLAEEHLFIARPNAASGEGWILGSRYDWSASVTKLALFDARRVEHGPIAEAELPYGLPLGLHGRFVGQGPMAGRRA